MEKNVTYYTNNTDHKCFVITIAGLTYEITSLYPSTYNYCRDYLSDNSPAIKVKVTDSDIKNEIAKERVFFYSCREFDGQSQIQRIVKREINENLIELVVLYRKIIEESFAHGVFFMHGAVIAVDNKAYMFTAPSGTGKTTHIMKWLNKGLGAYVVNGDKPLIKITKSSVIACGTPWRGNENLGVNTMVPLSSIVLMERSEENYIEEISFGQAIPSLLQQIYIPDDQEKAKQELKAFSQLNGKVRFFKFYFNNFKDDCFTIAYNALINRN